MPSKFTCEVCSKVFKTTQHLNQHKNRKKKCEPCNKPEPVFNTNLLNTIIENSSTSSGGTTLGNSVATNLSDITSSILSLNPNNNTIVSIQTLIELIVKYKSALDEIKKLETSYESVKNHLQKLQIENSTLKKQIYIVNKFIDDFGACTEKENEVSYISALTEPDMNSVCSPIFHSLAFTPDNLHFPQLAK